MECAAKGLVAEPCASEARRRCGGCGAVAYCSRAHQNVHWGFHKEECARLAEQMSRIDMLKQFPFTFSVESPALNHTFPSPRCFLLESFKLHQKGLWKSECICDPEVTSVKDLSKTTDWSMGSALCPCTEPEHNVSTPLTSWKDYYRWRSLPLQSPVAVLLHWTKGSNSFRQVHQEIIVLLMLWKDRMKTRCKLVLPPLTLYHCVQLSHLQTSKYDSQDTLCIHYLGPEKELYQLAVFGELRALFPGVRIYIELVGPAVPKSRDGELVTISNYAHCCDESCFCKSSIGSKDLSCSAVTFKLRKGLYHERYSDIVKDSKPHLIVAANAGIAAYPSWISTIEIIRKVGIPAIFTDFCEEAAHLASSCIASITGQPLRVPGSL
uniref:MYND-type domain-containing protein n=1 Tax=Oryza nivara TaxID=4536 RepID=A0A0E0I0R8_ORYNI